MKSSFCFLFAAILFHLFALQTQLEGQNNFGSIEGTVTDSKTGEILPFVNVAVNIGGRLRGATTDFDGFYKLDSIRFGVHDLTFSYVGYQTKKVEEIDVKEETGLVVNTKLHTANKCAFWCSIHIVKYNPPLFDARETRSGITIRRNRRGHFDYSNIR